MSIPTVGVADGATYDGGDSMTKKWSSTASMDGQTKRQASKKARREFVESIVKADSEPPEATFDNVDDMLDWLKNDKKPATPIKG